MQHTHDGTGAVTHLDAHGRRRIGRAREVIADDRTVGGIRPAIQRIAKTRRLRRLGGEARRRAHAEQVRFRGRRRRRQLLDRRRIVQDPDATRVRRHDQVVLATMHQHLVHRNSRQVATEPKPVAAAGHADVQTRFGAGIQHLRISRILAQHLQVRAVRQVAGNVRPRRTTVGGAIYVRLVVIHEMALERRVGHARCRARGLDVRHDSFRAKGRHVAVDASPCLSIVTRDMQVAVVGARPDQAALHRRLGHAVQRVVVLGRRGLLQHRTTGETLSRRIVLRQVGRDDVPRAAEILRTEQHLRPEVEHPAVMRRGDHRRIPVEAILQRIHRSAVVAARLRRDVLLLQRLHVGAENPAALRLRHDQVRVLGVRRLVVAVAVAHEAPVIGQDALRFTRAVGPEPVAVVLQAAAKEVERLAIVGVHLVELRQRKRLRKAPVGPHVVAHRDTAVVHLPHARRVQRIDPDAVVIAVDAARELRERAPTVDRLRQLAGNGVHAIGIHRIHAQLRVVEAAAERRRVVTRHLPVHAEIVTAPHEASARLGDGIDHVGAGWGDANAGTPDQRGQAVLHLAPRATAIDRSEDAAQLGAAGERPLLAIEVPHRGVDDVRILRVHVQIGTAMSIIHEQRPAPRLAGIARHEDATFRIRPADMPHRADEDRARVSRADLHARNVARVTKADETPARTAIRRLVHPASERHRIADVRLAGAHIHHRRVARLQRNVTDGERGLRVEQRLPRGAAIACFPDAARGRADIHDVRVTGHTFHVGRATHHVGRSDAAECEASEHRGVK